LVPQTFYRWTKQRTDQKADFVEVSKQLIRSPILQTSEILIEKGDMKIHIPISIGCNELRKVMEGLGAAL